MTSLVLVYSVRFQTSLQLAAARCWTKSVFFTLLSCLADVEDPLLEADLGITWPGNCCCPLSLDERPGAQPSRYTEASCYGSKGVNIIKGNRSKSRYLKVPLETRVANACGEAGTTPLKYGEIGFFMRSNYTYKFNSNNECRVQVFGMRHRDSRRLVRFNRCRTL